MRGASFLIVACTLLGCGNAPPPSASPNASAAAPANPATAISDPDGLCRSEPPECKLRIVATTPFCGPTAGWQMQQAHVLPGDPRATQPVKACTCDHCASDGDCTEKAGGHCSELAADMACGLPEKRCVYPNGPCAACPNACFHSGDSLSCAKAPPPPSRSPSP